MCEWEEFGDIDWQKTAGLMAGKLVFDAKRMFDPKKVKIAGLSYIGVGIGVK